MFFNIFKRKKKEINESAKFSKEDLQWNKMWELWADEKIESPYYELMDYLSGINGGGHHCHFDNTFDNSNLNEYVINLKEILPEPLKTNIEAAYAAYITNPDDVSEKDCEILSKCDDVYYENEELVNQILKERAKRIKL